MNAKRIAITTVTSASVACATFSSMLPVGGHALLNVGAVVAVGVATWLNVPSAVASVAVAPSVDPQAAMALLLLVAFLVALAQAWPEGGFSAGFTV